MDSRSFRFINGKAESLFLQRKNPRKIHWTVVFRKMHKKGITEEVAKKRTRKVVKHQRAIVGASLEKIQEKRNVEVRKKVREDAIKKAKEHKRAAEQQKKQSKPQQPKQQRPAKAAGKR